MWQNQNKKKKLDKWDFFLHFVRSLGKNPAGSHSLKWYDEYCLFLERCNKITLFCKVQNPKIAWGYDFSSLIYNKPILSPLISLVKILCTNWYMFHVKSSNYSLQFICYRSNVQMYRFIIIIISAFDAVETIIDWKFDFELAHWQ